MVPTPVGMAASVEPGCRSDAVSWNRIECETTWKSPLRWWSAIQWRNIAPGAQTERRGGAGPVRGLLGGKGLAGARPECGAEGVAAQQVHAAVPAAVAEQAEQAAPPVASGRAVAVPVQLPPPAVVDQVCPNGQGV